MVPLTNLLISIINNYLIKTYCLSIFSDSPVDLICEIPTIKFNTNNLSVDILYSLDIGCTDFIISTKNPMKFLEAYDKSVLTTNQRRANRKLIFAPVEDDLENRNKLIDLLKCNVTKYVPDILLILPKESDSKIFSTYELGTQKYVGKDGHQDLIILDVWNSSNNAFDLNVDLFYDKLNDLENKTIRIATHNYLPYAIFNYNENGKPIDMDGIDMRAAFEFCNQLKCNFELIVDGHAWGLIFKNGSDTGVHGNVYKDNAEIGFGSVLLYYYAIYKELGMTTSLLKTTITCITPSPLPIPVWKLPLIPFSILIWSLVIGILLFGIFGLYITGRAATRPISGEYAVVIGIGVLLVQPPTIRMPSKYFLYVINWLFVLCLFMTSLYSSQLSSAITAPQYLDPIDTVEQLADSGLEWGASAEGWEEFLLEFTEPKFVKLLKNYKTYSSDVLRRKSFTRDFAFGVEVIEGGSMATGDYITEESAINLHLMTDNLYWSYVTFITRKSSPYVDKLNKLFGIFKQAGLTHAWETQIILSQQKYKLQVGIQMISVKNENDRVLELDFLQGVFFVWCLGISFSVIAFLFEIYVGRLRKRVITVERN